MRNIIVHTMVYKYPTILVRYKQTQADNSNFSGFIEQNIDTFLLNNFVK